MRGANNSFIGRTDGPGARPENRAPRGTLPSVPESASAVFSRSPEPMKGLTANPLQTSVACSQDYNDPGRWLSNRYYVVSALRSSVLSASFAERESAPFTCLSVANWLECNALTGAAEPGRCGGSVPACPAGPIRRPGSPISGQKTPGRWAEDRYF